jgi:hypothetical protein
MTAKQNVAEAPNSSDLSGYFRRLKGQINKVICIDLVAKLVVYALWLDRVQNLQQQG